MNEFVFQNPTKIFFGSSQLQKLPEVLAGYGKKVLLVYGGGSIKRSGLYDRLTEMLRGAGLEVYELSGVEPNPRHTTVNRGVALCREKGVEVVLAVGGGSSIDCAKGIVATVPTDTDDVWDLVEFKTQYRAPLPLVTVLTVAATGSEMDSTAVISNLEKGSKSGLYGVRALVSFEDPALTYTVPAFQTACGSFDIMSHIFDMAYFSGQEQLDMLVRMQEETLRTVIKYAPIAMREPDNYEARANLMWASSWALNDFLYCGVFNMAPCHMMEHELSAKYDITHGLGLAILTPRWMRYVLDEKSAPVFRRFGVNCMGVDPSLGEREGAEAAIRALETFCFETLGLESRLSALGIDDSRFAEMAEAACFGAALRSIRDLDKTDVEAIYRMCL